MLDPHPRREVGATLPIGYLTATQMGRRAMTWWVTFAATTFWAAPSGLAQSPEPARLVYLSPAAEGCPSEAQLVDAVAARLGYDPFKAEARRTVRTAVLGPPGWAARIELYDARGLPIGLKELDRAETCAQLLEPMALAIALALDPLQLGPPPPPPAPAPKEAVALPTEGFGTFAVAAAPLLAVGALPEVGPGGRLELALSGERFGLGLEGRYLAPTSQTVEGGEVTASILAAALSGCVSFGSASACGLFALGALRAQSERLLDERKASGLYASVGVRGRYLFPVSPIFAVGLTADLGVTLTRVELVDSKSGEEFWTTPPVHGILGLEARFSFPD